MECTNCQGSSLLLSSLPEATKFAMSVSDAEKCITLRNIYKHPSPTMRFISSPAAVLAVLLFHTRVSSMHPLLAMQHRTK